METLAHRVCTLANMDKQYPQLAYSRLGVLLQIKWQYLQRTFLVFGTLMGLIEDALREMFFAALSRWE